jgi:cytochrome c oxidase subunit 1/cytochrome c oxidase subunit I+III
VLVTTLVDAAPDHRTPSAGPSLWPFLAALVTGVAFIGVIFTPWGLPIGIALGIPVMVGWFWPRGRPAPLPLDASGLPSLAFGHRAPLWWGVLLLVAIEATAMGILLVSYFYVRGNNDLWPPAPLSPAAFRLAVIEALLLVASYPARVSSVRAARRQQLAPTRTWLVAATVLGVAMLLVRAFEIPAIPFRWDQHAYGSVFWTIFGLHVTHVLTGVLENAMLIALLWRGPVEPKHFGDVEASALLWYFVVLEWVPGFAILYLEPRW